MQLSHTRPVASASFDDPNLVSCAGLVPTAVLAQRCDLAALTDEHLSVPTDKGANAGAKVSALVAGMIAGADRIDDMALLRHGAMGTVFARPYAPSTLGSFLREFRFGHVRQLDAVASRLLAGLGERTPVLAGIDGRVLVDIDDTIIEVHGYAKQGSGYGYSGVRGLNALIATATTEKGAPVIVGQRLRKGSCGSPRGSARMVGDTLAALNRLRSSQSAAKPLLRADSAFYGHPTVAAAIRGGAQVSITVRLDPKVKAAIADIDADAWTPIEYTDAIFDEPTGRWISRAEVAEIGFTAFSSRKSAEQIPGRLIVRRIPRPQPGRHRRAEHPVRHLALPRLLHHHRPRHRHRRQDPPRPRHHRAGPRRPQELRPGPSALRAIRRECRLAGPGRHGLQPDPRRSHHHRPSPGQSPHRDHPPHPDHRAGPHRLLSPPPEAAPTKGLALGTGMEDAVQQRFSPKRPASDLTLTLPTAPDPKDQVEQPDNEVGRSTTPTNQSKAHNRVQHRTATESVDRG